MFYRRFNRFRSAEAEVLFYFPIGLAICVIQRAQKLERASDVCKGCPLTGEERTS
jgi:hypothetical protein